jgi:hypothetical protein
MSYLLNRVIFNISTAAKQFEIFRNKYLIPTKPARALSAYILFYNEHRKNQTGTVIEIAKKIGE